MGRILSFAPTVCLSFPPKKPLATTSAIFGVEAFPVKPLAKEIGVRRIIL
jgi:hypothetical protein